MRQRTILLVSLVAVALCALSAWAQAPQIPSFSADMKMTGHNGEDGTGKVYFNSDRHMRMEMNAHGHNMVMMVDSSDINNPKSTMLMPEQKMYMEMSGRGPMAKQRGPQVRVYDPNNPCAAMEDTTCKKVGVETVNGYVCDKWEFTGKSAQTVWISQKMHFPIKTVHQDGTTVEFSNIKEGPQDAKLFAVPGDYRKFDPMGMAGGHAQE